MVLGKSLNKVFSRYIRISLARAMNVVQGVGVRYLPLVSIDRDLAVLNQSFTLFGHFRSHIL
jgi:hypothetical protein